MFLYFLYSPWTLYPAAVGLAILLAWGLAALLRLDGFLWRFALIAAPVTCAVAALAMYGLQPGIDLTGAAILVYRLEEQENPRDSDFLLTKLDIYGRFARASLREPLVRPHGEHEAELIFPSGDHKELERAKTLLASRAKLELRIVASPDFDAELAAKARASRGPVIVGDEGQPLARWVRVLPSADRDHRGKSGKIANEQYVIVRRPLPAEGSSHNQGPESPEILVLLDSKNVGANDFAVALTSVDEDGRLKIIFHMTKIGGLKLAYLTSENLPSDGRKRTLAIILDDEVICAAHIQSVISEHGQITGKFTEEETERITAALKDVYLPLIDPPLSEHVIVPAEHSATVLSRCPLVSLGVAALALGLCVWLHRIAAVTLACVVASFVLIALGLFAALDRPITSSAIVALTLLVGVASFFCVGVAWHASRGPDPAQPEVSELRAAALWGGIVGLVLGLGEAAVALPVVLVASDLLRAGAAGFILGGIATSIALGVGAWVLLSAAAELHERSSAVEAAVV